ncbi:MAG: hypothetical protein ACWGOW_06645 [Gammaproteobacteria bacterium]
MTGRNSGGLKMQHSRLGVSGEFAVARCVINPSFLGGLTRCVVAIDR